MQQNKQQVYECRERLNETLSSPDLSNYQSLNTLIRKQLHKDCNEDILLDQRVSDLSSIIEKLRSVSTKDQDLSNSSNESSYGHWKLKHDDEDCRVMYREGLKGSPFHTLLVEGFINGTIEDCLCVCWESSLYEKWWPKMTFPSFKILETKCLEKQKFGINEQICLLRVKAPWPLTDREAILKFFLFEYFKDGLVIILLNSIEVESNGIAEVVNAVRIDFVGGVAIQKVTQERSYIRFIAEMDIKLDLVPPSLINFTSRQILGNGFKLFKKTIGSVAKSDDYTRVLADPLYTQIHEALYSTDKTNEFHGQQGRDYEKKDPQLEDDDLYLEICKRDVHEIEEEEDEKCLPSSCSSDDEMVIDKSQDRNVKTRFCISPEVKQALGTLERVISMVRKSKTDNNNRSTSCEEEEEASSSQLNHSGSTQIISSNNRQSGSSSCTKEGNKIAPASPEMDHKTNSEVTRITISQATTLFSQTTEKCTDKPSGFNGGKSSVLHRKRKPGCFGFRLWREKRSNLYW